MLAGSRNRGSGYRKKSIKDISLGKNGNVPYTSYRNITHHSTLISLKGYQKNYSSLIAQR
jgi:hypothetical protein